MKNQTHTATPWKLEPATYRPPEIEHDVTAGGSRVLTISFRGNQPTAGRANAEFICRAVNCHEQLLEALLRIADRVKYHAGGEAPFSLESIGNEARAAIAAAQGGKEAQ